MRPPGRLVGADVLTCSQPPEAHRSRDRWTEPPSRASDTGIPTSSPGGDHVLDRLRRPGGHRPGSVGSAPSDSPGCGPEGRSSLRASRRVADHLHKRLVAKRLVDRVVEPGPAPTGRCRRRGRTPPRAVATAATRRATASCPIDAPTWTRCGLRWRRTRPRGRPCVEGAGVLATLPRLPYSQRPLHEARYLTLAGLAAGSATAA
jgi:hypothetical protein